MAAALAGGILLVEADLADFAVAEVLGLRRQLGF